jgi:hypothetical protein
VKRFLHTPRPSIPLPQTEHHAPSDLFLSGEHHYPIFGPALDQIIGIEAVDVDTITAPTDQTMYKRDLLRSASRSISSILGRRLADAGLFNEAEAVPPSSAWEQKLNKISLGPSAREERHGTIAAATQQEAQKCPATITKALM